MPEMYNVTIEPAEKENRYRVKWHNAETDRTNSFDQSAEITTEETRELWRLSMFQLSIGQKLYRFLDGQNHDFRQALEKANRKGEILQLYIHTCRQTHDWPFELLADGAFLLPTKLHLVRNVSTRTEGKTIIPQNRPLKLLFMASSALDVKPELDYEREEEAIFEITANLPIEMEVEDSGTLEGLRGKLEQEKYDVVHLSGHAGIAGSGRPYFIMENETGDKHLVYPYKLWNEALIENAPRLLFLSGRRTQGAGNRPEGTGTLSIARLLVKNYNLPALVGWGRAVSDEQAVHAGKMLFRELSRGESILDAVQRARYELITDFPTQEKPAWPMLRLYSSGTPLKAMVKKGQRKQPKPKRMKHVYLKNSRVKVLAEGFVGRRRQMQTAVRALKLETGKLGVMILGAGGLGKSCLAGKICERFPEFTLIIVHGKLNTVTLEPALEYAFVEAQDEGGQQILTQKEEMTKKLAKLCAGSFKEKKYLILLDDFEQNLEGAEKGRPGSLLPEAADLLKVLLHQLTPGNKNTRLIVTCRYKFSLAQQGRDPVREHLQNVWLTGFRKAEQRKKARALVNIANYPDQSLAPGLLAAGHGNPRLMEWIDVLVGEMKETEVKPLLEAVKDKQEDFIRQHVIRELLQREGEEFELFLRRFSIYRRPVKMDGVGQVTEKSGKSNWKELLKRGMDLSLIEHDQARHSYRVTPLLREELLPNPKEIVSCHQAALAYYKRESDEVVELDRVMTNNEYNKITGQLDSIDPIITEELIFHALGCGQKSAASFMGGILVTHLGNRIAAAEALRIGLWILEGKRKECCTGNDAFLLSVIANTYISFADYHKVIHYSQQALPIFRRVFGTRHPNVTIALNSLGMAYTSLGNNQKAIRYYSEALDITGKSSAKDQPETSLLLNNLGAAHNNLGQYQKAIHYFKQALSICKKAFSQEHHSTLRILNNLGAAYDDLGDYTNAIDYYKQVLTISRKIYDEKHPNISGVLNNLGSVYNKMGDHAKAVGYLEQARSIDRALQGEEHPDVARELYNLGIRSYDLGDYPKAIDYFEQALTIWKKTYGQTHPQVATAMSGLGLAWSSRGEHKKAIENFQQALHIDRAAYGENHPGLATTLNNLGTAYRASGDYPNALDNYEQALNMWKKFHKENHPLVATGLNNLGEALISSGDPKKAIDHLQQALIILKATFGEEHPNIAGTLNNLGLAYKALAQYSKAIEYLQQALSLWEKIYGPKHPKTAMAMNNLGSLMNASGKPGKAIEYLQQALIITKILFGETHPDISPILHNLGSAYNALGDRVKAIDHYEQSLATWKHAYGENNPKVAEILFNLGEVYQALGQHEEAIDYYRQSLAIIKKIFTHNHPRHALLLNRLGLAFLERSEPQTAIGYFEQELSINRALYGEEHQEIANTLNNLGLAWYELEDYTRAIEYYKQAHTIFQTVYGDQHPDVATVLNNLALAWYYSDEFEKAKNYFEKVYQYYHRVPGPGHPDTKDAYESLRACKKTHRGEG